MLQAPVSGEGFEPPEFIFTINGDGCHNPRSAKVIEQVKSLANGSGGPAVRVLADVSELQAEFANGHRPEKAVVLFDEPGGMRGHFKNAAKGASGRSQIPIWAHGTMWGLAVGSKAVATDSGVMRCANHVRAAFGKNFLGRLDKGDYPWGPPRKGEKVPILVRLPDSIGTILERLNDGPNLVAAIATTPLGARIPPGTKISWLRVPGEVATYPRDKMERTVGAMAAFERACVTALQRHPEIGDALLAGVDLDPNLPRLVECYLRPTNREGPVAEWSVRRPDMHVNGSNLVASENDEMPGGFTDLVHIDASYGVNQDAWRWCFDWLHSEGPLLFVVSDGWSKTYIESTKWLVGYLTRLGYETRMVTTAELDQVTVTDNHVEFDGTKIGTIWRQFPVFETTGKLAELVFAAEDGKVRMVPEFGHFGNKTWFSLFWKYASLFQRLLPTDDFATLQQVIPRSRLVCYGDDDFPMNVGGMTIHSFGELIALRVKEREPLVLKITGANDRSARSYGVFMGHARSERDWREWLAERQLHGQAFIVQECFDTSVERIAVMNLERRAPEIFPCRVLLRPWMVGGRLISSHNCCTPKETTKVHGMVDMAVQPVLFI